MAAFIFVFVIWIVRSVRFSYTIEITNNELIIEGKLLKRKKRIKYTDIPLIKYQKAKLHVGLQKGSGGQYHITNNEIYFWKIKIPEADARTFTILGYDGRLYIDKNHLYGISPLLFPPPSELWVIEDVDVPTLEAVGEIYKDKNNLYVSYYNILTYKKQRLLKVCIWLHSNIYPEDNMPMIIITISSTEKGS